MSFGNKWQAFEQPLRPIILPSMTLHELYMYHYWICLIHLLHGFIRVVYSIFSPVHFASLIRVWDEYIARTTLHSYLRLLPRTMSKLLLIFVTNISAVSLALEGHTNHYNLYYNGTFKLLWQNVLLEGGSIGLVHVYG